MRPSRNIGRSSLTISGKRDLAWAGSQPLIPKGEQSGSWMRMATDSVSSSAGLATAGG